jgi:hypothetical protein
MLNPTELAGFYKYQVTNDSLIVFDKKYKKKYITNGNTTSNSSFKILALTNDLFRIIIERDTVLFHKINPPQDFYKFEEIYFRAEDCDGDCPEFDLRITSDGLINYTGYRNTEIHGHYSVKIDSSFYTSLNHLFKIIDIKNYPLPETHPPPGAPSLNLKIKFQDNDSINIIRGSYNGEYDVVVKAFHLFETLLFLND